MWVKLFLNPRFINRVHLTWSHRSLFTMQLKTKEFESLFTDGLVGLAGKLTSSYAIITLLKNAMVAPWYSADILTLPNPHFDTVLVRSLHSHSSSVNSIFSFYNNSKITKTMT